MPSPLIYRFRPVNMVPSVGAVGTKGPESLLSFRVLGYFACLRVTNSLHRTFIETMRLNCFLGFYHYNWNLCWGGEWNCGPYVQ